jgi:hypothetical protein
MHSLVNLQVLSVTVYKRDPALFISRGVKFWGVTSDVL